MRLVIQRVGEASVSIQNHPARRIDRRISRGLLVLTGIAKEDTPDDAKWLARKTAALRIFEDAEGKTNRSVADVDGEVLVVSQFTLLADTGKGTRPSFHLAAAPEDAIPLYELFVSELEKALKKPVSTGEFGASMKIALVNEGPFTIVMDSPNP